MMDSNYKSSSGRSTPTSRDFAEQIKQLELEGSRLIKATNTLGESFTGIETASSYRSGPSIAELADITSEQKTISELREHLDLQSRETERLHKSIYGENKPLPFKPSSSNLENLEIPISKSYSLKADITKPTKNVSFALSSNSDEVLRVTQNEVIELQKKLSEAMQVSEKQKHEFRTTISDLKFKLQEATVERDSVLAKQKQDYSGHDALIKRLQKSIEQLESTNRTQEKALMELNDKMEQMQKQHYIVDTSLTQLRQMLTERERRRGKAFYETEPLTQQSVTMLVHTVERCLQEMDAELEFRQDKIKQLSLERDGVKASSQERMDILQRENESRITRVKEEYERKLEAANHQSVVANERVQGAHDEMMTLQQQLQKELRAKEDLVLELEGRVNALRRELEEEHRSWNNKRDSMQMSLDEREKEIALVQGERDKAVRSQTQLQNQFSDMESQIEKLATALNSERSKLQSVTDSSQHTKAREERLEGEIRMKDDLIKRLENSLATVKKEADEQLKLQISSMEKEGRDFIERQITQLKTQLEAMTDRCHQTQLQLEVNKTEMNNLKEKYTESKTMCDKLTKQLENSSAKKDAMDNVLKEKLGDLDRTTKERDSAERKLEEIKNEMRDLKCLKDKLEIKLEEREKNFLAVQQQNNNISAMADSNAQTFNTIRQERDELQTRINDKIIETEEIRKQRDALEKSMQSEVKQMEEMKSDNVKLARELRDLQETHKKVNEQRDSLLEELKKSRYEVASLVEGKQNLEQKLIDKDAEFHKDIAKVNRKLKVTERDFKLAQQTIKTRENVDGKAVKVAGKMQKEVTEKRGQIDSLQTRLRWLEECLDAALKDKKLLQEAGEKMNDNVRKTSLQNERLSSDLKSAMQKCAEMQNKCSKLEGAVEKASVKMATNQATLEQYEQDIARLKLKHQLELKEAARSSRKQGALPPEAYKPTSLTTTQSKDSTPRSTKGLDEIPVCIKPNQQSDQVSNEVGQDLRVLLNEMKGLLQSQQKHKNHRSFSDTESEMPEKLRKSGKHRSSKPSAKLEDRPASPVSDLILGSTIEDTGLFTSFGDVDSKATSISTSMKMPSKYSKGSKSAPLATDAQALAKRLEKKIENLTKIGGQLQSDNKETVKLMKEQEKRLNKVKTQMGKS